MINVLVTGGAGYIGSHTCKTLYTLGYNPITIDNLIYGHREHVKWGDFYHGDIGDVDDLNKCFDKYEIHAVMHFSAFAYVGESVIDPRKYYDNNLRKAINLLHCMLNRNIKYFIFSSTCATYGDPVSLSINEGHPQNPINPYGRSKLMIENIIQDYDRAYGLKHTSLRYFNAAGADPDCEIGENHNPETHLIPLLLDVAAGKRDKIEVFGLDYDTLDGSCIRDYIHVMDLARAHVLSLKKLLKGGHSCSYNLGTGKGHSVLEIIDSVSKVTGRKIPFVEAPRREGDPAVLVASNQKALSELQWSPDFTDINDIVSTAWEWHKKFLKL